MRRRGQLSLVAGLLTTTLFSTNLLAKSTRYLVVLKSKEITQEVQQIQSLRASGKFKFSERNVQPHSIHRLNLESVQTLPNINSLVAIVRDDAELAQLEASSEVALVEKEIFHPAPKPILVRGNILSGPNTISSHIMPQGDPQPSTSGTPWGILAVKAPEAWEVGGSRGDGARVLVLDTGLDKEHQSIGNNFEEGHNFVEEDSDPSKIDDPVGHGTHVSGTIAGVADETGFSGVAPKAKILMGRVCSEEGCSNISVARGINWGIEKKVDIISMSLGGAYSTPGERQAIHNAEKANIVVVAAAGNEGVGRVGYPAALSTVIAVGAVDSSLTKAVFSQWGPELDVVAPGVDVVSAVPRGTGRVSLVQVTINGVVESIKSSTFQGSKDIVAPEINSLVFAGLGKPTDLADGAVKGKFALLRRGEIPFVEKVKNALNAGAAGVIIFNNEDGLIHGTLGDSKFSIPVVGLDKATGEKMVESLVSGQSVSLSIQNVQTDYLSFDGTSMACPHVAGVVALMKAVNKNLTPAQVRSILTKTSSSLSPNEKNQYGAGMVNAVAAVQAAKEQQ